MQTIKMALIYKLTSEEAVEFCRSKRWEKWTPEQRVIFDLHQQFICFPLEEIFPMYPKVFGRPVHNSEILACKQKLLVELDAIRRGVEHKVKDIKEKIKEIFGKDIDTYIIE